MIFRTDSPLSRAEELIFLSARSDLSEDLRKEAKALLKKGIDGEFFMENAMRSGLAFLFYGALDRIGCPSLVPEHFAGRLKTAYLSAVPRMTARHRETVRILNLFSGKGIPVVPLKGSFLSRRLYGDIAARGLSVDTDLFVKEKDSESARIALEEAGYSLVAPDELWDRLGQYVFRNRDREVVDLHWEISPALSSAERMKGFWEGAIPAEKDGARFYEFRNEELLIQLAAHLTSSVFLLEMRYAADANELLGRHKDALDWKGLAEKAKKWKLSNSLYALLILSRSLFDTRMPDWVLKELEPVFPKRLLVKALAQKKVVLRRDSRRRRFMEKFLKYVLFQLLEARSPKEYLAILFPPKEKMGDKGYLRRITEGVAKFLRGAKT